MTLMAIYITTMVMY